MLSGMRAVAFVSSMALALTVVPAQIVPHDEFNRKHGLERSEVVQVITKGQPGQGFRAALSFGGQWTVMELTQHSVRGRGFKVLAQDANGQWTRADPGPVVTMRGHLVGHKDSRIAASLLKDGLYARIVLAGGTDYWLEPMKFGKTPLGELYVLYRDKDVIRTGHRCGTDRLPPIRHVHNAGSRTPGREATNIAELGCDADFEYFQDYGSVSAVGNRIQSVINTMNLQYDSQVDIEHQITTILVRTSSNQPYASTDAVTLLNQFRNEWLNNQGGIARDVAQLFTGKEINGGTIGIAWIGQVCTSFGFGVVQSDFNNNFSCATDLSAHELGHNWNAPHCSCTGNTMNPFITCANTFTAGTISTISSFRNSRTCLSSGGPTNQAPSVSAGPNQTVAIAAGASLNGTVSDDGLPNPPGAVTTTWSRVSGPGTVTFGNASAVDTTASFSAAGSYVLQLTASDSALSANDTVSITVQGGGTAQQLAFDNFDSGSGSGGTGWSSVWTGSGNVRLTTGAGPHSPSWHVRLRRTGTARRSVNLAGAANVKLIFWAKIRSFESNDRLRVRVSTNGGGSFSTVKTFVNGDDDNVYRRHEISLSSVSSNMVILFDGDMSSNADYGYFDDIELTGVR